MSQEPNKQGNTPRNDEGQPRNPQDNPSEGHPRPRSSSMTFMLMMVLCLLLIVIFYSSNMMQPNRISWGDFMDKLDNDHVVAANIEGTSITGAYIELPNQTAIDDSDPEKAALEREKRAESYKKAVEHFRTALDEKKDFSSLEKTAILDGYEFKITEFRSEIPSLVFADTTALNNTLYEKLGNHYSGTQPPDNSFWLLLISLGLSIGIVIFFIIMIRRTREQMMGGGGGVFPGFSRSPARKYDSNSNQITFDDVAGLEGVKKELMEIVDYLREPEKYTKMGARVPKGMLLMGPPGTGKTLLGRAVAGEAGVPFYAINGSEFIQLYAGVGASRVRDLFYTAKENAPAILFIDEIDAVGRHRGAGIGAGHDEREQTLNQILSEMDGFAQSESVMVMAATNRPDVLDPALLRPGRFDRHITVDRPTMKGRIAIFTVHIRGVPLAEDVDLKKLAKGTVGFTGADIRNLVNEATLWATRNNKDRVDMSDFDFARDKVMMGLRREEALPESEKSKTAYHEAGHTILAWFEPINSRVHKVSIIPRGRALGSTQILPEEDQLNISEKELYAQLACLMGGRVAEKVVFNELSAGAENDLKRATRLARKMVANWGMSERLGPIAFRLEETHPFLGRDMSDAREFSERTAELIDDEVFRILRESEQKAIDLLNEKRELLDKLAFALETEEELEESRISEILGPSPFQDLREAREEE